MIGKKIGKDNIYIHETAIGELPWHLKDRLLDALEVVPVEFTFNFVITHPDYISFLIIEDFDTTFEPVLGERWKVDNNQNGVYIPCPDKPKVLHQRYKTVKPDYYGFDIEQDKLREKWYRQYFSPRDMAGAGYQHKWKQMLETISEPFPKCGNHNDVPFGFVRMGCEYDEAGICIHCKEEIPF